MVFISYLQVNWPELHDIEPLDIPGVELEETEVRHKYNFETVGLLVYARTISGVRNVTILFGRLDRQTLKLYCTFVQDELKQLQNEKH